MIRTLRHHSVALWAQTLLAILVLLQAGRWILWGPVAGLPFHGHDFHTALALGLRFDLLTASYAALPILVAALVRLALSHPDHARRADTLARRYAMGAVALVAAVLIANFGFYQEYRDQFNTWIFGAVDDDLKAVTGTFLSTFHWGRYLLAFALAGLGAWLLFRRRGDTPVHPGPSHRGLRLGLAAVMVVIALGACRGGFGRRPIWISDAYACAGETANRLVPNPVYLLRHLIHDRIRESKSSEAPAFVGDIRKHAAVLIGNAPWSPSRVTEILTQTVRRAAPAAPPKHVYLVVMESYDKWPMTPPYDSIGLSPGLAKVATLGASSPYFVSGGAGTMVSLAPIITGIPPCGPAQNYQTRTHKPFPTSVTTLFKQLGYRTRLAYGGYGAWQRITDFAKDQGFDDIITGAQIPCPAEYRGEWGVPDGFLFEHLAQLADSDKQPTLTVVMSTSYHPPYALPLGRFDCLPLPMPEQLAAEWDHEQSETVFTHLKYADRELKKFTLAAIQKHPDCVIAITGDHWSRKFLNNHPTLSQRREVPFVLVAPGRVAPGTRMHAGVHMDIVPTLLHLCAPDGYTFPAFGADLLAANPPARPAALGNATYVHASGLVNAELTSEQHGAPLGIAAIAAAKRHTDAQKALAWWLLMRGDALDQPVRNN